MPRAIPILKYSQTVKPLNALPEIYVGKIAACIAKILDESNEYTSRAR